MVKAAKGVLIQCDPSIKAIINKIDEKYHDFIIEDLDDETVVVKETKLYELKQKLADVSSVQCGGPSCAQMLDFVTPSVVLQFFLESSFPFLYQ